MVNYKTHYKCHACGTASYQRVIVRDPASGAWKPTGAYKCAGCRNVFENLQAWWQSPRQADFQSSTLRAS